jgi:DNA-binding transcriptional MerR regulator
MQRESSLHIGNLAKVTDTKVVTIRYYEQIGLLPAPSRNKGNYRVYNEQQVRQLQFIRRCRDLGFTINQVRELLHLSSRADEECNEVDRITAEHLASIEIKISQLRRLAKELRRLSNCCQGKGVVANCRILEALS